MRSAHRKCEIYHEGRECALKRSNAFLSKKVEADQNHNLAQCISTRQDNKTYSTACHKTVYSCLEYQVPVSSVCNVIHV